MLVDLFTSTIDDSNNFIDSDGQNVAILETRFRGYQKVNEVKSFEGEIRAMSDDSPPLWITVDSGASDNVAYEPILPHIQMSVRLSPPLC